MSNKIDVDPKLIRKLADIMKETDLTEIEVGCDDFSLRVARGGTTVVAAAPIAAAPAAIVAPVAEAVPSISPADHPGVVTSPMVGVAYTSAEPGAAPFVNVGDPVKEGQVILLIEAMKVFNQIKAPKAGTVKNIFVEANAPVEFGEPLLIIE